MNNTLKLKDGFSGERALVLPQILIKQMEKSQLLSALHITDIGYYPKATHHYRMRNEGIDQFVFIYCIDGTGWYKLEGKEQQVKANQFFILPAGKPHAYGSNKENPWTIYWIHFKGSLAMHYAEGADIPIEVKPENDSRIHGRNNLFEEMFHTLNSGYSLDNLHYATTLLHYYLGSLRYLQSYRHAMPHQQKEKSMIEIVIHFMKENLEKHLTVEEMATFTNYTPNHFSTLFKAEVGHPPLAYFNLLKIQEACRILDSTDIRLNQLCHKVGIDDSYYFSRLFSKIMGMSPREYRHTKKG